MNTTTTLLLSILLLLSTRLMSQNTGLDTTFGNGGIVITTLPTPDMILDIQEQSDGKIIALGEHHLVRYNTDGSLDSTFGTNGIIDSLGLQAKALLIHQNDDIYVGGQEGPSSVPNAALLHFLSNGARDNTFGQNGKLSFSRPKMFISAMDLQADGKIVAGITEDNSGSFTSIDARLYRLNPNGTLDSTFNHPFSSIIATSTGRIQIMPNNQILVVGYDQSNNVIGLFNSDGSIDSTYGTNGIAYNSFGNYWYSPTLKSASAITSTAKLFLENWYYNANNFSCEKRFNSFDNQGIIDTNFQATQSDTNCIYTFNALAAYSDDRIISARGSQGSAILQMLDKNANLDTSCFLPVTLDFGPNVLLIDGNGDILVAGQKDTVFAIAKVKQSCPSLNDFVTSWKTDNPGLSNNSAVTIYTDSNYSYNYDVDWNNDGVFDTTGIQGNLTIQYSMPGTYAIRIKGDFPSIKFGQADREKLVRIDQWGNQDFKNLEYAFDSCMAINFVDEKSPVLDSTQSLNYMFKAAGFTSGAPNVGRFWEVSNIQSMEGMFQGSGLHLEGENWDVSNVTDMNKMFKDNIINRYSTFPPGPIITDTLSVTAWNVSNVTNMSQMFEGIDYVIKGIENWNVSSVNDMSYMFKKANRFNSPIGLWNVSNVITMEGMFYETNFNQPLNTWNVSSVTNMNMMFRDAWGFNQPLNSWDVSSVTDMTGMFVFSSFNQPLSTWVISSVTTMGGMLSFTSMSVANYDSTLIGWQANSHLDSVNLGAHGLKYCLGKAARDSLIADGWAFEGDSLDPACMITNIKESNKQMSKLEELLIYPNPSNGNVFIEVGKVNSTSTLYIYNQMGQMIREVRINEGKNQIYLGDLAKGIYLVQFGKHTQKLILQD